MKTLNKILFFLAVTAAVFGSSKNTQAAGPTIIKSNVINTETTWTKAESPYVLNYSVNVNAQLTIEPGTVIKFNGLAYLYFNRDISVKGTDEEKIIFTSYKDDSAYGDTNGDGSATMPAKMDGGGIRSNEFVTSEFENVQFSYLATAITVTGRTHYYYPDGPKEVSINKSVIRDNNIGVYIWESTPSIQDSTISNNNTGIYVYERLAHGIPKIGNSSIFSNTKAVYAYPYYGHYDNRIYIDATQNWWGDVSGPYFKSLGAASDNLSGNGNPVSDGVMFDPWSKKTQPLLNKDARKIAFPM